MDIIDGTYIKAGKKSLYAKATGRGNPAIVIETALGSLSAEWTSIQYELSNMTTVISYDRAGYGESAPGNSPRTSDTIASELKEMLDNTGIPGPYIFIGSSLGGLYLQHFAKKYPDMVSGLVFADTITTGIEKVENGDTPYYKENASTKVRIDNVRPLAELENSEFEKIVTPFLQKLYPGFPDAIRSQLIAYQTDQNLYKTVIDEHDSMMQSIEDIKNAGDFPDVPVKIICRDPRAMIKLSSKIGIPEEEARYIEETWMEEQKALASNFKQCDLIVAENSDHQMHFSNPKAIIDCVNELIMQTGNFVELG